MKKTLLIACLLLGSVATFAQRDLGYRGFVDLGGGIGVTGGSRFTLGLSTVHGYQAAPFLFVGAGIGVKDMAWKSDWAYGKTENDGWIIPVFGDIRVDVGSGMFSPFVDMRAGYDFICGNGLYLNPSIGVHYAKSDNFGFNLSAGYEIQGTDDKLYWKGKEKKSLGFISIKFGIDF